MAIDHACRVALGSTKVRAIASKQKAMSYGRMRNKVQQLKAEVKQLLSQAETADAEDDRSATRPEAAWRFAGGIAAPRIAAAPDSGSETGLGSARPRGGRRG
ncbi:MAG TPA: hypothetical protein VNL98_01490 [Gemmatimonadales bacterium]|nr:hypothetical protein [Gemmatimonadales bacterium]